MFFELHIYTPLGRILRLKNKNKDNYIQLKSVHVSLFIDNYTLLIF